MYSKELFRTGRTVEGMSFSSRGRNSYLVQYKNCRLLRDHRLVRDDLWVRDGIIQDPRKLFWEEKIASDKQVDCGGCIISPGFIDTQINGGFGFDFSSATTDIKDSICLVAKKILAHGVTAFCPTIITSSRETYKKVSTQYSRLCDDKHSSGAKVLGLHLEGPFISKEKRGAHPSDLIRSFAEDGFNDVMNMYHVLQNVAIVTLAPEIHLSDHVIRALTGRGIRVALGHSVANLEESERAVENGANFITHLFNAMLPFHHRDPGLVGLLGSSKIPSNKIVYYGIIADGIHTNPAALRIAYKAHPEGVVLITDAIPAMGLDPGSYSLGSVEVEVTNDGRTYVKGTTTLAGSVATLDTCVRIFKASTRCSTVQALEAASLHPARMLGIEEERGTLNYGSRADFAMLDDDLNVLATYLAGETVYSRTAEEREDEEQFRGLSSSGEKRLHNGSRKVAVAVHQ